MGFNRVYPPEVKLEDFISDIKNDLGIDSEYIRINIFLQLILVVHIQK